MSNIDNPDSVEYKLLKKIELSPPNGWFVFGTHVDKEKLMNGLEFYGEEFSLDGLPIWEKPL